MPPRMFTPLAYKVPEDNVKVQTSQNGIASEQSASQVKRMFTPVNFRVDKKTPEAKTDESPKGPAPIMRPNLNRELDRKRRGSGEEATASRPCVSGVPKRPQPSTRKAVSSTHTLEQPQTQAVQPAGSTLRGHSTGGYPKVGHAPPPQVLSSIPVRSCKQVVPRRQVSPDSALAALARSSQNQSLGWPSKSASLRSLPSSARGSCMTPMMPSSTSTGCLSASASSFPLPPSGTATPSTSMGRLALQGSPDSPQSPTPNGLGRAPSPSFGGRESSQSLAMEGKDGATAQVLVGAQRTAAVAAAAAAAAAAWKEPSSAEAVPLAAQPVQSSAIFSLPESPTDARDQLRSHTEPSSPHEKSANSLPEDALSHEEPLRSRAIQVPLEVLSSEQTEIAKVENGLAGQHQKAQREKIEKAQDKSSSANAQEPLLEVVACLRRRAGASSYFVCVLGSSIIEGAKTDALVSALAQELFTRLPKSVIFVVSGFTGVHKAFLEGVGDDRDRIWNLQGSEMDSFDKDPDTVQEVFSLLGDVYLVVEGTTEESQMAHKALRRGASVVPVMRTGGASSGLYGFPAEALERPAFVGEACWALLSDQQAPMAASSAAASAAVAGCLANWCRNQKALPSVSRSSSTKGAVSSASSMKGGVSRSSSTKGAAPQESSTSMSEVARTSIRSNASAAMVRQAVARANVSPRPGPGSVPQRGTLRTSSGAGGSCTVPTPSPQMMPAPVISGASMALSPGRSRSGPGGASPVVSSRSQVSTSMLRATSATDITSQPISPVAPMRMHGAVSSRALSPQPSHASILGSPIPVAAARVASPKPVPSRSLVPNWRNMELAQRQMRTSSSQVGSRSRHSPSPHRSPSDPLDRAQQSTQLVQRGAAAFMWQPPTSRPVVWRPAGDEAMVDEEEPQVRHAPRASSPPSRTTGHARYFGGK